MCVGNVHMPCALIMRAEHACCVRMRYACLHRTVRVCNVRATAVMVTLVVLASVLASTQW